MNRAFAASWALRLTWWAIAGAIAFTWATTLRGGVGHDAECYLQAAQAIREGQNPYAGETGYLYPPALALVLAAADPADAPRTWNVVLAIATLVLVGGSVVAARMQYTIEGLAVMVLALLLTDTIPSGYGVGNASFLVGALLVLAGVCHRKCHGIATPLLLAIAAVLKLVPVVFLAFLAGRALRTRDRTLGAGVLIAGALMLATVLLPWSREFLGAGDGYAWNPHFAFGVIQFVNNWALGSALGPATAATLFAAAIALAFALGWFRLEWQAVYLAALVATPLLWYHLYFALAFPLMLSAAGRLLDHELAHRPRAVRALIRLAAFLAVVIPCDVQCFLWRTPGATPAVNLLQRGLLPLIPIAAVVLAALYVARRPPLPARHFAAAPFRLVPDAGPRVATR